jgi:glycosyltransferase involved in cell wall biosynthesis
MLSFVMVTHNDGAAFEEALHALAPALQRGDRLLAIDTGSTDGTLERLSRFGEGVGCDTIRLDTDTFTVSEALALGLLVAQTAYVMLLDTRDRVHPGWLWHLRNRLKSDQPDLAMINTVWWSGDLERAYSRVDAARMEKLPPLVDTTSLQRLCPEPRRMVLARAAWRAQAALLAQAPTAHALYTQITKLADSCAFVNAPIVHQHPSFVAPVPLLEALGTHITRMPRRQQANALQDRLILADDLVNRTPPDRAAELVTALETFAARLSRWIRPALGKHEGPAGALWRARKQEGRQGALLWLAHKALAEQQQQNAHLTKQVEQLHTQLEMALPKPDYLRALYDRVRNQ